VGLLVGDRVAGNTGLIAGAKVDEAGTNVGFFVDDTDCDGVVTVLVGLLVGAVVGLLSGAIGAEVGASVVVLISGNAYLFKKDPELFIFASQNIIVVCILDARTIQCNILLVCTNCTRGTHITFIRTARTQGLSIFAEFECFTM